MVYKIGDKVCIISSPTGHDYDSYREILHCFGEIVYVPHGKHRKRYAIKVDGHRNTKVSRINGCYWLEDKDFRKIDEKLWQNRHKIFK